MGIPIAPLIIIAGLAGTAGAAGLGYGLGRSAQQGVTMLALVAGGYFLWSVTR